MATWKSEILTHLTLYLLNISVFTVSLLEYWLLGFGSVNTKTDTGTGTWNSVLVTNQPTLILYTLCNTKNAIGVISNVSNIICTCFLEMVYS